MASSGIEKNILRVVAYFDMFHYPVSMHDIHLFLDQAAPIGEISLVLEELTARRLLYNLGGVYASRNEPLLAVRRTKGAQRAGQLLPVAYRIGRFLGKFPFIRGVGISGSLSKHFADEQSDIDFFIITSANRLWVARSLLHCVKKISYLFGRQHWFCMNYFIDETVLQMPEKNQFIATELLTLKPVTGTAFPSFFTANEWALRYFPNHALPDLPAATGISWYKRTAEKILDNKAGDLLDEWLMHITAKRWSGKESKGRMDMKGTLMSIRIDRHSGRPNPDNFQKKILESYTCRVQDIENRLANNRVISYAMK